MPYSEKEKPKLFLHVCCAVCGVYISSLFKLDYSTTLFYYNPNIYPETEYMKRLGEIKKISEINNLELIIGEYDHASWLKAVKGHEKDREGKARCAICYYHRIKKTAQLANEKGFDYFTTTLSVSPHKKYDIISKIGKELSEKYKTVFLDRDFKKQDGFKKSMELSKKLHLYRQNYCGCEFSIRG